MNRALFYLFRPFLNYKAYANPVAGWQGWYEFTGKCIAFRDTNSRLFFNF